ncbi:YkvA family protein [Demequina salsinemoris]|uniref:YkvA family protein n=1 Tax=Demequina salsinemoris TaxID=577470 RepID=UPI00078288F2|nr:YkvA family protein [Demequina salsinemoris]
MWWRFAQAVRRGEHRLSVTTWLTAVTAVLYTILPVDLIPELFLGPFGFVDDLGLWGVLLMLATREKNEWELRWKADERVVDAEAV